MIFHIFDDDDDGGDDNDHDDQCNVLDQHVDSESNFKTFQHLKMCKVRENKTLHKE